MTPKNDDRTLRLSDPGIVHDMLMQQLREELESSRAEEQRLNRFCELKKDELDAACELLKEREAEVTRLKAELAQAHEALRNLVSKVKECTPAIDACISISAVHHCPYQGPNWVEEMAEAEKALASREKE